MICSLQSLRGASRHETVFIQYAGRNLVMTANLDQRVESVFETFSPNIRTKLLRLRKLILETANNTDGVGPITETLKWGEPAYLTETSKSGSTIRLGWKSKSPDQFAIYFNCNTSLVESFRHQFPGLRYDGNRAIIFKQNDKPPKEDLCACFVAALTYHKRKRAEKFNR